MTSYAQASGFGTRTKVTLTGDTYAHREWIKANGGRWDKNRGTWTVPVPSNNRGCAALAYEISKRGLGWS